MRRLLVPLVLVLLSPAALPASASAQADLSVLVSDSPDPVQPDGNITYTVTVANNGPQPATNATLGVSHNGTLRFQSVTAPAGWSCTPPAPGSTQGFTCSAASFTAGASPVFTVVLRAAGELVGINDTTINTNFAVTSPTSDPVPGNNAETESTAYVAPDADLSVTAADSPATVGPDQNLTYTVTVANNGPDAATSAALNVANSGTLRFQSASVPAGWNCTLPAVGAAASFSCTNPSLASGASSEFSIVVRPTTASAGTSNTTLTTSFSVSSGVADPNAANNGEIESTQYVVPGANLAVTASGPASASPGGPVAYSVNVSNAGGDAAQNATLTAVLPANLLFASITIPAGWNCSTPAVGANGTITCTLTTFASAGTGAFTVDTTVAANASGGGTIATSFSIDSSTSDPVSSNNVATVTTSLQPTNADLSVTLAESADPVTRGDTLTYTATVTNAGPGAADGTTLTNVLPAGLVLVSAIPSSGTCTGTTTITCTIGTIAAGGSATVVITATVAGGAPDEITNTVTVDGSRPDPNALNDAASVTTAARNPVDLRLTAVAPAAAVAGDPIAYAVTVVNEGGAPATGVELALPLPAGTTFASLKQTAGPAAACTTPAAGQRGSITCTTGELPAGATQTFELVVRAAAAGDARATFSVSSASADGEAGDQAANVATAVTARTTPPIVQPKPEPTDPCTSRRRFMLRLIRRDLPGLRVNLEGARIRSAVVRTRSGRTLRKLRFTARRVRVDLRRLKPARYVVRMRVRLRSGRTITATARYRTCRAPA